MRKVILSQLKKPAKYKPKTQIVSLSIMKFAFFVAENFFESTVSYIGLDTHRLMPMALEYEAGL